MIRYNSNKRQPFSYAEAIRECKKHKINYFFARYENGGIMLVIDSPGYGPIPYRGSICAGKVRTKAPSASGAA